MNIPVLVNCDGGIDRSPFIVAYALFKDKMRREGIPKSLIEEGLKIYERVKKLHPATVIHDDWMRWLLN